MERSGLPLRAVLLAAAALFLASGLWAHGVAGQDEIFLTNNEGLAVGPYMYLGAKHMVTGYDHLAFLAGVIFFLYRFRDVALYVTLFAVGHSVTLLVGVLGGIHANPFLIDAIVGLSVAYKAFENLGGFRALGVRIDTRAAVLVFGLFHGFGLATKLQPVEISGSGLVGNVVSFNVGVELGQFAALAIILLSFNLWRASGHFQRHGQSHGFAANAALMTVGFLLVAYQLTGYFLS
ncbi:MAG: HupE/UreJ family protein [Acidobacteria bacterium]|nr:HupE/UreJ family protein [Acidobacteriota bacterium]